MMKIKSLAFLLFTLLSSLSSSAQNAEMADLMRDNGKIYVVVAVLATIFVGIVVYLISIDRRIARLEKGKKP